MAFDDEDELTSTSSGELAVWVWRKDRRLNIIQYCILYHRSKDGHDHHLTSDGLCLRFAFGER